MKLPLISRGARVAKSRFASDCILICGLVANSLTSALWTKLIRPSICATMFVARLKTLEFSIRILNNPA